MSSRFQNCPFEDRRKLAMEFFLNFQSHCEKLGVAVKFNSGNHGAMILRPERLVMQEMTDSHRRELEEGRR